MSSLLTSNALLQKCYTENPISKNVLVKLSGYDLANNIPKVSPVTSISDTTILGVTSENIADVGVTTEVIYKGVIEVTPLPSGTFVNSEIYWNETTQELTSSSTNFFVGWVSEVFPSQKVYVDILNKIKPNEISVDSIVETPDKQFVSDIEKSRIDDTPLVIDSSLSNVSILAVYQHNCIEFAPALSNDIEIDTIVGATYHQKFSIYFKQDAIGGRSITLPASVLIPSGELPDMAPNSISILYLYQDVSGNLLGNWKTGW